MVVTAWVMLQLTGDKPVSVDPTEIRGDNVAAVTWAIKCGWARDKRVCLLMRMTSGIIANILLFNTRKDERNKSAASWATAGVSSTLSMNPGVILVRKLAA